VTRVRAALLLVLCGQLAAADEKAEHTMAPQARAALEHGLRSYAIGQYADAIREFRAGYQIDPQPEFLYALGQALRLSGECGEAIAAYRSFLRTGPSPVQADSAKHNVERCQAQLDALQLAPVSPPAQPPVEKPGRRWSRDVLGGVLVGVGAAFVGTGGALWGVGEQKIETINGAQTYVDFSRLSAGGDAAEAERAVGISGVAIGGALVVAGAIRWAYLARRH
jgi:tetratricopeptide (TPR) repeat protein